MISRLASFLSGDTQTKKIEKKVERSGKNIKQFTVCAPYIVPAGEQTGEGKQPKKGTVTKGECLKKDNKTKKCTKYKPVKKVKSVHKDSCLTPDVLKMLVTAWNKEYPDERIKYSAPLTKVWETLRDKITKHVPLEEGEHAWLEQDWVYSALTEAKAEKLKDELYRPEAPEEWRANPRAWLSTTDIEEALTQYETKYPTFKFFGASPIDFDLKNNTGSCVVNSLCKLNLRQLIKGRNPSVDFIGVVFNLDKHNESGSHWVSLFVNIPKGEINFWDSFAVNPPPEVSALMKKIQKQAADLGIKLKIQINKKQHQFKNTECGMYSINFIAKQLEGKSFNEVCAHIINDDKMNGMRNKYFTVDSSTVDKN
jgi:hypothetical protein